MKIELNLKSLSMVALMGMFALTACSQKPSNEEIAAQVKIALEQEKAKEAAAASNVAAAPVAAPVMPPATTIDLAKKGTPHRHEAARAKPVVHESATAMQQPVVAPPRPVCANCGVVVAVNVVEEAGKGSGVGLVAGGVVGGLVGNQVGSGSGRDLATIAGVVGGAFAGNAIEKNAKKTKSYHIVVRMEDGSERTYRQPTDPHLMNGDKVRIENDAVMRN